MDRHLEPLSNNIPHSSTGSIRSQNKRGSTRVIRTFEEVEVRRTVMKEEWYEELECGICAHILHRRNADPCTLRTFILWALRLAVDHDQQNLNITCPHCRTQVSTDIPFVPSVVLEQIVDRKLKGLVDGEQKVDLQQEREEKAQAWKVLQTTLPAKTKPRSRGFDEWFAFFDAGGDMARPNRRASRHLTELGTPISRERPVLSSGELTLSDLRRLDAEQQGVLQRVNIRLAPPDPSDTARAASRQARPHFTRTPTFAGSASPPTSRPPLLRTSSGPLGRPIAVRSQILAARQSRGRTREDALVVHSDSDEADGARN